MEIKLLQALKKHLNNNVKNKMFTNLKLICGEKTKTAFVLSTKAAILSFIVITYNRKLNLQNRASDSIQSVDPSFAQFLSH